MIMIKGLIFTAVAFAVFSCSTLKEVDANSNEKLGKSYGPVQVEVSNAVDLTKMLQLFEGQSEPMELTFVAPINQVCMKAGCWVNIDKGNGETFMVRFKDHFTIPIDTKIGTKAYMHGTAYWDEVSVEMLKHFAEDAGESAEEIAKITEPQHVMSFEADGIVLVK
jgi:hypothetical protein